MKINFRKAILAGAIAAVISVPTFAGQGAQYERSSEAPGKTESDVPRGQFTTTTTTSDSLNRQQNMDHKSMGTEAKSSAPPFATEGGQYERSSEALGKTESDMPMSGQSTTTTGDSLDRQQNMDNKSMGTAAKSQVNDNPIYLRSADSLDGVEIVGVAGEEIGTIKNIVLTKDRRSAHAVVSTGGIILGVGARDILVSLDELNTADDTADDKLQMNTTQKQLETRQEYQSEQYIELEGDKPIGGAISEFSAFETENEAQDPALAPEAPESSKY